MSCGPDGAGPRGCPAEWFVVMLLVVMLLDTARPFGWPAKWFVVMLLGAVRPLLIWVPVTAGTMLCFTAG